MKILSSHEMRALDEYNIKSRGMASIDLMENASKAVAGELVALLPSFEIKVVVFAGPGNNGGDGLAIARIVADKGYMVEVFLFNTKNNLSDDCLSNKERLKECKNVSLHEITSQFDFPNLSNDDVIVDALFGTGLNRPLMGGYRQLVEFINNCKNKVVSVDIPSGMLDIAKAVTEGEESVSVKADYTFTFHCLKPAMLLADNQEALGNLKVLDIGLDDSNINFSKTQFGTTETDDARLLLKKRDTFGHKGTFGHGLLVAGSSGMAGASFLAGKAAYRSGVGKLTIHTGAINVPIVQTILPEAVVSADANLNYVTSIEKKQYSAVGIGPGLGCSVETEEALFDFIKQGDLKLVIDADGLNILSKHYNWAKFLPKDTILTPHPGEWERMIGKHADSITQLRLAMDYAKLYGIYIILKGHYTAVCTPNGHVYFNVNGNSGMATAGSGDILAGIILSLRCQGYSALDACRLGVWLHGRAGDCAATKYGEHSMMASDMIECLGDAFKTLM